MTATYVLDGTRIATPEDFWRVVGEGVNGPGGCFGRNLDALADCLGGGCEPAVHPPCLRCRRRGRTRVRRR